MIENTEYLDEQDIINLTNPQIKWRMPHTTFSVDEFLIKLSQNLVFNEDSEEYLKDGVPVRILSQGKLWRKGKVRLSMEFIPDENIEPPSLLDDFRK
ncbi:KGK domain-containing protein [Geminocystis herdmanii]|uniref:KGK domain-containing protein n=1 Tax=Geminocystis herdmanii TaxID=669359 RepID=UPI0003474E87|nr:KGK domain-containing protein [Geminocystis herdmanii]